MSPASPPSTKAIQRRGLMLVISSPSGAGKSTIARNLLEADPQLSISVSVTTRNRRPSEIEGRHYFFKSIREFEGLRQTDALLEWAEVHGNFYGTPRGPVERALSEGRDVLFDIDWQGTLQLYEKVRSDVVSVFVLPPTAEELKERLVRRAEDTPEVVKRRLRNALEEIPHWTEYDYVLVNQDLQESLTRLRAVLTAERLKRVRQQDIANFIDELLTDLRKITP